MSFRPSIHSFITERASLGSRTIAISASLIGLERFSRFGTKIAEFGWGLIIVAILFAGSNGLVAVDPQLHVRIVLPAAIAPVMLSLVSGWIRERTDSIWLCVLGHNLSNIIIPVASSLLDPGTTKLEPVQSCFRSSLKQRTDKEFTPPHQGVPQNVLYASSLCAPIRAFSLLQQ